MFRFAKALVATGGALITAVVTALADGDISSAEYLGILGVLVTGITAYRIPNRAPVVKSSVHDPIV